MVDLNGSRVSELSSQTLISLNLVCTHCDNVVKAREGVTQLGDSKRIRGIIHECDECGSEFVSKVIEVI